MRRWLMHGLALCWNLSSKEFFFFFVGKRQNFLGEGKHTLGSIKVPWKLFYFSFFVSATTKIHNFFSPSLSKIQHGSFHFFTSVAEFFFRLSIAHNIEFGSFFYSVGEENFCHGKLLIYDGENSKIALKSPRKLPLSNDEHFSHNFITFNPDFD